MKKIAVAGIITGGAVLIAAGGYITYAKFINTPSIVSQAAEKSMFPLYSPTFLPQGYALNNNSSSLTSQAYLVTAENQDGKTLIFTQMPVPAEYDFESFYKSRLTGAQDAYSVYGRGKVGILDGSLTGSLVTDSTWVLVKGPEEISANDMIQIILSLEPLR